jgi:hypothetical protein
LTAPWNEGKFVLFLDSTRRESSRVEVHLYCERPARKDYEAQLKPLIEQPAEGMPEASPLEKTEKTFFGLAAPHWGHFNFEPSSPTFCRTSNL